MSIFLRFVHVTVTAGLWLTAVQHITHQVQVANTTTRHWMVRHITSQTTLHKTNTHLSIIPTCQSITKCANIHVGSNYANSPTLSRSIGKITATHCKTASTTHAKQRQHQYYVSRCCYAKCKKVESNLAVTFRRGIWSIHSIIYAVYPHIAGNKPC